MVNGVAAAGLELCRPAPCRRQRRLLDPEARCARANQGQPAPGRKYEPIEMPKNSPTGFVNAFFAVVTGFALIWHIWWMAAAWAFGAFVTFLVFAFREEEEIEIPAETDCPVRSRSPGGGRAMSIAVAVR